MVGTLHFLHELGQSLKHSSNAQPRGSLQILEIRCVGSIKRQTTWQPAETGISVCWLFSFRRRWVQGRTYFAIRIRSSNQKQAVRLLQYDHVLNLRDTRGREIGIVHNHNLENKPPLGLP